MKKIQFAGQYWHLALSAFGLILLSEMGDKTQITTMLLAGIKPTYAFWVGLGSATALICTSFVEVVTGSKIITRFFKPSTIKFVSGVVFLLFGALLVFGVLGNVQLGQ